MAQTQWSPAMNQWTLIELIVAAIGILLTIYFGVHAVNRRKQRQVQKVGPGASAIQSGRDTKIER